MTSLQDSNQENKSGVKRKLLATENTHCQLFIKPRKVPKLIPNLITLLFHQEAVYKKKSTFFLPLYKEFPILPCRAKKCTTFLQLVVLSREDVYKYFYMLVITRR